MVITSQYSVIMQKNSPSIKLSWNLTILGWSSLDSSLASCIASTVSSGWRSPTEISFKTFLKTNTFILIPWLLTRNKLSENKHFYTDTLITYKEQPFWKQTLLYWYPDYLQGTNFLKTNTFILIPWLLTRNKLSENKHFYTDTLITYKEQTEIKKNLYCCVNGIYSGVFF